MFLHFYNSSDTTMNVELVYLLEKKSVVIYKFCDDEVYTNYFHPNIWKRPSFLIRFPIQYVLNKQINTKWICCILATHEKP